MAKPLCAVLAVALLGGCGRVEPDAATGDGPLRAVATTGIVADAVANVGGDRIEVTALMGPGVDPHLYRPSEGDVRRLADAELVFFNGLHLEAKLSDVLAELDGKAVAVTDGIGRGDLLSPPEFSGQYDPHVWFDVRLWMQAVERVRDALVERDPTGRAAYERNARRYLGELERLEADVRRELEPIPEERRVVVTAHDAFNYFGRAYDFEVRGLQGISTAAEAGARDVQDLAEFIAERRLPAIFVETSVSPRAIEAVREAVRARGHEVRLGEQLYSDALGDPGSPAGTYVGMVRHNVRAIVDSLTPER